MSSLREARADLVATPSLRGAAFGRALANVLDHALIDMTPALGTRAPWALVALGSYARRELCPGSDVDVMLVHEGGRRSGPLIEAAAGLWYPLWDAGFVLGHAVRTVRESLALADDDLDAMTALLDVRIVAGDETLADDLVTRARRLAPRRRGRLVEQLAAGAAARLERPGPIAEMLEPNLKDGAGGLRDLQAPGWVGWALAPAPDSVPPGWAGGVAVLVDQGYLHQGDAERLREARAVLLDARVALHRATGGKSDQLALQDQDVVARLVDAEDADAMVRTVGAAARSVLWITTDMWARLLATERGPEQLTVGTRRLEPGIELRDHRVTLVADAPVDAETVLRLAAHAARLAVPFDRATLTRLSALGNVEWTQGARTALVDLLGAGRGTIAAFESLDHVGVLERLVPEWRDVRARPQRNAYHRFTVDRHSLEAVVETAAILDPAGEAGAGFDGDVARNTRRDVLLLAALLHDIAKGHPGDHSEVGVDVARAVAERIGLDPDGVEQLAWAIGHHLLLADTATRRDLSDESTIERFAAAVGTTERNHLLYALTIADSRATGPSAWNASKAGLVRELFVKTDALLAEGPHELDRSAVLPGRREELEALAGARGGRYLDAMPVTYVNTFPAARLVRHLDMIEAGRLAVEWADGDDGLLHCTVVAPDRTGLLATVASTLALVGFDIASASGYSHPDGMAVEVFRGRDRFGRLITADERERARATLASALAGELDLDRRLQERTRRYRPRAPRAARDVRVVVVDPEASARATVVEVDAPDDIGLLGRITAVFVDLGLDVTQAIVSTIGDRVVDVFYLRDASGGRLTDRHAIE